MKPFLFPNFESIADRTVLYLHDGLDDSRSLLAIGERDAFVAKATDANALDGYQALIDRSRDWVFTALSYDLKNELEQLPEPKEDPADFPLLIAFVPRILLSFERGDITILRGTDQPDLNEVIEHLQRAPREHTGYDRELKPRVSKLQYLDDIRSLQAHIQRGDIYEVNYCQEFYHEQLAIHPYSTYRSLHQLTKAPFSAFLRHNNRYLLCASPERYFKKEGDTVISQPIKGTTKRGSDAEEDARLVETLRNDPKERGENIMITDLVRNDLSRSALPGSVSVDELCGIHSFATVHQMISTVRATYPPETSLTQIIRDTFPMGSMTGAPKVRAMELIEQYEHSARGLYSGSVGYIKPNGDADFNVVIRSLLYNADTHYLSARVGGAITALSDPKKEYDECLLKAEALFKALR